MYNVNFKVFTKFSQYKVNSILVSLRGQSEQFIGLSK